MACGGCLGRQAALMKMMEAARQRNVKSMARQGAYVVKSAVRDVRSVLSSASAYRTQRR